VVRTNPTRTLTVTRWKYRLREGDAVSRHPSAAVARLSLGERAISREQAFVLLDRLDQVEAQLDYLRHGVRQLLADIDRRRPQDHAASVGRDIAYARCCTAMGLARTAREG
jgi:hypothetical protein